VGAVHDTVAAPLDEVGSEPAAATVSAKTGNAVVALPSLTEIWIPADEPTLLSAGVPERRPVAVSNSAQAGRFAIEKPSASPSASAATGTNVYFWPAVTLAPGEPEIVGAELVPAGSVLEVAAAWPEEEDEPPPLLQPVVASMPPSTATRIQGLHEIVQRAFAFNVIPTPHQPSSSSCEQRSAVLRKDVTLTNASQGDKNAVVLCRLPLSFGNPAVWFGQTGGFASPSHDGFAFHKLSKLQMRPLDSGESNERSFPIPQGADCELRTVEV